MPSDKKKYLHANHRSRMRKRFSVAGFDGYHPHEVLEQLLFEAIPRVNTNETAHLLLNEFGSLENVLRSSPAELERVSGIGKAAAAYLASRLDAAREMIMSQYSGLRELSIHQIAFLADWHMRAADKRNIGIVICGADGDLRDFDFVFADGEAPTEINSDALTHMAERICDLVSEGTYYLVMKELVLEPSDLYKLLDDTRMKNAVMLNAYRLEKKKPISVIYPE